MTTGKPSRPMKGPALDFSTPEALRASLSRVADAAARGRLSLELLKQIVEAGEVARRSMPNQVVSEQPRPLVVALAPFAGQVPVQVPQPEPVQPAKPPTAREDWERTLATMKAEAGGNAESRS